MISRTANSLILVGYPILAYISCSISGFLWHRQLTNPNNSSLVFNEPAIEVYLAYYGAVIFSTLCCLFYDSRILRFLTFAFTSLFIVTINKDLSASGYPVVVIFTFILATYPRTTDSNHDDFVFSAKTFLICNSLYLLFQKVFAVSSGQLFFSMYEAEKIRMEMEVYSNHLIESLIDLGPITNHALELLMLFNVLALPITLFKSSTKYFSFVFVILSFAIQLQVQRSTDLYQTFILLAVCLCVTFLNTDPKSEQPIR